MNPIEVHSDSSIQSEDPEIQQNVQKIDEHQENQVKRIRAFTQPRIELSRKGNDSQSFSAYHIKNSGKQLSPSLNAFIRKGKNRTVGNADSTLPADLDLLKKKARIRSKLRDLNQALLACIADPLLGLVIRRHRYYTSITAQKTKHSAGSIRALLRLIRRAITMKIPGVSTDHGVWVSVSALVVKVGQLIEENAAFKKLVDASSWSLIQKNLEFFYKAENSSLEKSDHPFPFIKNAKKLQISEERVQQLLLKIHPNGKAIQNGIDPIDLLLVYPKYITTKKMFELVYLLLNTSDEEVSFVQKFRLLSFCRIWVSKGYYLDDQEQAQAPLQKILKSEIYFQNTIVRDLFEDLSTHIMKAPLSSRRYRFIDGDLSVITLIDSLKSSNQDKVSDLFAKECFYIARGHALNISLNELLPKGGSKVYQKQFTDYVDQLSYFVKTSILMQAASEKDRNTNNHVYQRLKFWIKTAIQLVKRGDFSSSFAIFTALDNIAISRLYCATVNGKSVKTDKRISKRTFKKWQELEDLFSTRKNFGALHEKMAKRREEGLTVIPYLGVFLSQHKHIEELNKDITDDGEINLNKFELTAKILRAICGDLEQIKKNKKRSSFKIRLHTDLKSHLITVMEKCRWDLLALSKQIKPDGYERSRKKTVIF